MQDAVRIVVKVGSSSLTTPDGVLDQNRLYSLVDALAEQVAAGKQIVLVTSGAVAAGIGPLRLPGRPRALATQQAAASVGQGLLLARYTDRFRSHGITVGQVLLTSADLTRRAHYSNARHTLECLLSFDVVPIVNENDTVATHKHGDNDRLAALVAHLIKADAVVLLSDIDALYDGHPLAPGSKPIPLVTSESDLAGLDIGGSGSEVGSGGMSTKVNAAIIATSGGVPVVLTSAVNARMALRGDVVGTLFEPAPRPLSARYLWLAHATKGEGALILDAGAVAAVVERRKSLLPAGIVAVQGDFAAGRPVDLLDPDGTVVARGLSAYDASELPPMLGRSTRELAAELGPSFEREVVHADDLVILAPRV
ncbi:MAG: glutamate 5-kinase [Actinobacteria bacterium]|nr:glutamate 5-kinase [Actinomycetota bacterium]